MFLHLHKLDGSGETGDHYREIVKQAEHIFNVCTVTVLNLYGMGFGEYLVLCCDRQQLL